jgi:hypothetical protein
MRAKLQPTGVKKNCRRSDTGAAVPLILRAEISRVTSAAGSGYITDDWAAASKALRLFCRDQPLAAFPLLLTWEAGAEETGRMSWRCLAAVLAAGGLATAITALSAALIRSLGCVLSNGSFAR